MMRKTQPEVKTEGELSEEYVFAHKMRSGDDVQFFAGVARFVADDFVLFIRERLRAACGRRPHRG